MCYVSLPKIGNHKQYFISTPSQPSRTLAAYEILADAYNEKIEHKPHNAYYDRPNTLSLLPPLAGKTVLDAGCGPGKYAEIILSQGANVTGFDISPKMIQHARERNEGQGHFFVHDLAAPLDMLQDNTFDVILCALALHYIDNWTPTIQEFHRVLRPSGQIILSIGHPFADFNYFGLENYFAQAAVSAVWQGFGFPVEVPTYYRSLQDCLQPFLANGFFLDHLLEPRPVPEFAERDPKHFAELNAFPGFLCLRFEKR